MGAGVAGKYRRHDGTICNSFWEGFVMTARYIFTMRRSMRDCSSWAEENSELVSMI